LFLGMFPTVTPPFKSSRVNDFLWKVPDQAVRLIPRRELE